MQRHPAAFIVLLFAACAAALSACDSPVATQAQSTAAPTLSREEVADLNIVTGQLVFVPAYSEVAQSTANQRLEMTVTLAIHNSDLNESIIINSVRYYDTNGTLIRDFVESPVSLAPMATTGFIIGAREPDGGWGANFLVEWGAPTAVYEPVIEALMVSGLGTDGVSFISPGRVVSEKRP
jgi:hypothetical protein